LAAGLVGDQVANAFVLIGRGVNQHFATVLRRPAARLVLIDAPGPQAGPWLSEGNGIALNRWHVAALFALQELAEPG
jgi:hypothetical protein